ncbi:hypothetical protein FITA111629_15200 [Filibacter tadaridae]|uniref:Uncharacterized protein n=1 Tax=Filibacter tadaridae TaxID=2483811 RepID=A0A3P5WHS3_9BACL|nr:hypothetical protein FILTAD_00025 [Filibacter tadaridae]
MYTGIYFKYTQNEIINLTQCKYVRFVKTAQSLEP